MGSQKKRNTSNLIIKILWITNSVFILTCVTLWLLIYNGIIGYMPPVKELRNPNDKYATRLYTNDGVEMGRYFQSKNNRIYADYDEISDNIINALIATEDVRFESHSGIDMRALSRVLFKTVLMGHRGAGGGSTITQQLAKLLYSPESTNIFDRAMKKPVEWAIAVKLERYYTKEEIIRMYLNRFDFLNNAVGIKSAAYVYFGKEPTELTIEEAATLVGMVQNPSRFNPVRYNERTKNRRNVVLHQMEKAGMLTEAECDSLCNTPLVLNYHKVDHKDGIAPYFREAIRLMLQAKKPVERDYASWERQKFVDDSIAWETNPLFGWAEKNRKPDGSKYNIYTDGLKIYTSLDSRMQKYAEEAVVSHLRDYLQKAFDKEKAKTGPYTKNQAELGNVKVNDLIDKAIRQSERYRVGKLAGMSDTEIINSFNEKQEMRIFTYSGEVDTIMTPRDSLLHQKKFLRAGFMSIDSHTGYVKAYVGGPDFKYFQYDMAGQGRRQIGSTVKPFLYTYAFEQGYTPCDEFLNEQPSITTPAGTVWTPRNAGKARIGEMVNLYWALTTSNNWISARLMSELSPAALVRTMHNFGITAELPAVMSLCLGPCDISVKEMVTAYTAFSNRGLRVDPIYVTSIRDNEGNILFEATPQFTEVISEEAYFKMIDILQNVINGGTGNRLRRAPYNITAPMGGKTGTTNYNSDGWFMGFTPNLVSGAWVGGDERYIHFNTMFYGQGASMALPIYGKYMSKVYADESLPYKQTDQFPKPPAEFKPCFKEDFGIDSTIVEPVEVIEGAFD